MAVGHVNLFEHIGSTGFTLFNANQKMAVPEQRYHGNGYNI